MSDWADYTRVFTNNLATIRVIAHIKCVPFVRHRPSDLIDKIQVCDKHGDEEAANLLFEEVKQLFLNRPCQEWYDYPTKIGD